jgi:anti-sigma factor ChrR (cupin superfamily)
MKIAADFSQRAIVHSSNQRWIPSPMVGVDRKPLDRVGGEVARATSVVRYAKGSQFSSHVHTGGEEFLVLEGTFQDEHGDYPAGTYIRNPPQSQHTPGAPLGCIIFVKLWQFQPEDRTHVQLDTHKITAQPYQGMAGVSYIPLYGDEHEDVGILHIEANTQFSLNPKGGSELFVLEGQLQEHSDLLTQYSWLRQPIGQSLSITTQQSAVKIWLKTGHLIDVKQQISRVEQH